MVCGLASPTVYIVGSVTVCPSSITKHPEHDRFVRRLEENLQLVIDHPRSPSERQNNLRPSTSGCTYRTACSGKSRRLNEAQKNRRRGEARR